MTRRPNKKQGDRLSDRERRLLEGWAYGWAHAAELALRRVEPADDKTMADRQADAMMFVVALAKVEMCAIALIGRDHPAVAQFRRDVGHLKDVRDILEHVDEYVVGQGDRQLDGSIGDLTFHYRGDHESLTLLVSGLSVRLPDAFEAALRLFRIAFGGTPDEDES